MEMVRRTKSETVTFCGDEAALFGWDTARYQRSYLMAGLSEDQVQTEILQELKRRGLVLTVTDAGRRKTRGQIGRKAAAMGLGRDAVRELSGVQGTDGLEAGYSDLSGNLAPVGRGVFLEVKAPGRFGPSGECLDRPGMPSPEQIDFLREKGRTGCIVGVVWSFQDALRILGPHLDAHAAFLRASA